MRGRCNRVLARARLAGEITAKARVQVKCPAQNRFSEVPATDPGRTWRRARICSCDPLWITLAQHFLKTWPIKMRSRIGFAPAWRGDVRVAYAFFDRISSEQNDGESGQDHILRFIKIPLIRAFQLHSNRKIIAPDATAPL